MVVARRERRLYVRHRVGRLKKRRSTNRIINLWKVAKVARCACLLFLLQSSCYHLGCLKTKQVASDETRAPTRPTTTTTREPTNSHLPTPELEPDAETNQFESAFSVRDHLSLLVEVLLKKQQQQQRDVGACLTRHELTLAQVLSHFLWVAPLVLAELWRGYNLLALCQILC